VTLFRACLMAAALSFASPVLAKPAPYQWQTIPFAGGGFVDGFLYHPAEKNLLYVRTDVGGAYRFDYAGNRWVPLMDGFGKDDWDCMGVLSLAVDPHNADRLYATCGLYLNARAPMAGVLRSEDRGRTWRKTPLPFHLGGNAVGRGTGERLAVDPDNPDHLLLGSNQDGLWVSTDRAKTFARVAGYPDKGVTFILFGQGVIYAGSGTNTSGQGSAGGGVYRSTDGGKTFTLIPDSPTLIPHQAALDAKGTLYLTFADGLGPHGVTNGAVYRYDGAWTDISPAKPTAQLTFGYSGLDLRGNTLVVSTSDRYPGLDDLYVSHDGGSHWTPVGPQAAHHFDAYPWLVSYMGGHDSDSANRNNMGHWMDAVKLNPFNPDELVYGTGYGVWMTRNLGVLDKGGKVDFAFADDNLEETVVLGLESPPKGPRVLMAAGDVGGAAFDDFSKTPAQGLFTPENKTNQSVAFAALKPLTVVRSVDNEAARGYISTDGAQSWTPLPSAPPPLTADWHTHRAGKIVISALGKHLVWVPEGEAAYVSADLGKTWALAAGWPKPERDQEAIVDKMLDNLFYAFDHQSGTVLISEDGGATFKPYVTGLPKGGLLQPQLRAVPGQARDLWLAAPDGLYHLRRGKAVRMKNVDTAWQVTFGKAAPGAVYPAVFLWGKVHGEEGIWRSDNGGAAWARINDDAHRFGQLRAMAGDPRRYGVLYISPDGRGTMVGQPK
jgi:hypothetical protein